METPLFLLGLLQLLLRPRTAHLRCARSGCRRECSFFATRQRTNQENAPRDLMSLGTLQCVFAGARSAQHDAKVDNFRFCEHGFKKAALTQGTRKHDSKTFSPCSTRPISPKFQTERDSKSLTLLTHLRGGIYAPQMEELCQTMLFRRSFFRTADEAVSKGGSLWFPFFRHFFVE